jgi:hypothetical protein
MGEKGTTSKSRRETPDVNGFLCEMRAPYTGCAVTTLAHMSPAMIGILSSKRTCPVAIRLPSFSRRVEGPIVGA